MKLTKPQFRAAVEAAYSIGYDDCANQAGCNIAVLQLGVNPKKYKRPKAITKYNLLQRAAEAAALRAESKKGDGNG